MRAHRFVAYVLVLSAMFVAGAAWADGYNISEDYSGLNLLNQYEVGPSSSNGNQYCAPTATMNSFMFLQKQYPWLESELYVTGTTRAYYDGDHLNPNPPPTYIYPNILNNYVPTGMAGDRYDTDGGILAGMMGTGVNTGTYFSQLVSGKVNYLQTFAPNGGWAFAGRASPSLVTARYAGEPDWIQNVPVNAAFLAQQLGENEDVEIWVSQVAKGNILSSHIMTLTSIMGVPGEDLSLDGYDPATGGFFDYDMTNALDPFGSLVFGDSLADNTVGDGYTGYVLEAAFAESPTIPEPATLSLLLLGGGGVVVKVARRKNR
jgi:hypothetical protein